MPNMLDTMRRENRLVTRIVGREVLDALIDLLDLLTPRSGRSRLAPVTILVVLARLRFDRQIRGHPGSDGLSVSAIARSLDLPFETVRRHVRQLEQAGWADAAAGASRARLPDTVPPILEGWCDTLGNRVDRIIEWLRRAELLPANGNVPSTCRAARTLAGLDLILSGIETTVSIAPRKQERFVIQLVVSLNAAQIAADLDLARAYGTSETVPPAALRDPVSMDMLARKTRLSHSTLYRLIDSAEADGFLERGPNGIRATEAYLASEVFIASQRTLAAKTALLIESLYNHGCDHCDQRTDMPPGAVSDIDPVQTGPAGLGAVSL